MLTGDLVLRQLAVDDAGMELSTAQKQRLRHYVELADARAGAAKYASENVQVLHTERRNLTEQLAERDRHLKGFRALPADHPEAKKRAALAEQLSVVQAEIAAAKARQQLLNDEWHTVGNLCSRIFEHLDISAGADAPEMLRRLRG